MAISVQKEKLYLTFADSGTLVASAAINHTEGWLKRTYCAAPSTSANVSGTLVLKDDVGIQLWSFGVCLSSTSTTGTYLTAADIPIAPGYSFGLTYGGIPGSADSLSATPLTAEITIWAAKV